MRFVAPAALMGFLPASSARVKSHDDSPSVSDAATSRISTLFDSLMPLLPSVSNVRGASPLSPAMTSDDGIKPFGEMPMAP